MKRTRKVLELTTETIRKLTANELGWVAGGATQFCAPTGACVSAMCVPQMPGTTIAFPRPPTTMRINGCPSDTIGCP